MGLRAGVRCIVHTAAGLFRLDADHGSGPEESRCLKDHHGERLLQAGQLRRGSSHHCQGKTELWAETDPLDAGHHVYYRPER